MSGSDAPFDLASPPTYSDDAYPDVIADQRHMLPNGVNCETGEQVFWQVWLPFLERNGIEPHLDEQGREVVPYINHSRWVADCPACNGGMSCWDRNPYTCCLNCGRMFKVAWKPPKTRAEIVRFLAGQDPNRRNWNAHKGETLENVVLEAAVNGDKPLEMQNGLLVAGNMRIADELASQAELLDQLKIEQRKALGL